MTLKIDKSEALRLCMACTMAAQICRGNAIECGDPERAALHEESAKSWERRREEIRKQVKDWEENHGTKA